MTDLLHVFEEFNPVKLPNGQIRMTCPFRENHEGRDAFAKGDGSKSFFASPDINAFHCFSCGEKGNLVQLLVNKFDVSYFEAVEQVNILPAINDEDYKRVNDAIEDLMYDLRLHPYLKRRGFTEQQLCKKFRVGVAPYTASNGTKFQVIVIPLYDYKQNLCGVKYRIPDTHTFWYSKGFERAKYLYNYSPKLKEAFLVEGETDLWTLDKWGLPVVSTLKGEVSDEQTELLVKIPLIHIAYDNDKPGLLGALNAYKKLSPYTDVDFINYPASDPNECDEKDFLEAAKNSCNYAEFLHLTELAPKTERRRKSR